MTKRKIYVSESDFRISLASPGKTTHLSKFSNDLMEKIKPLTAGAFVLVLNLNQKTNLATNINNEKSIDDNNTTNNNVNSQRNDNILAAVMWKCRGDSIDSLVAKAEVDGIISMLDALKSEIATANAVDDRNST